MLIASWRNSSSGSRPDLVFIPVDFTSEIGEFDGVVRLRLVCEVCEIGQVRIQLWASEGLLGLCRMSGLTGGLSSLLAHGPSIPRPFYTSPRVHFPI